MNRGIEDFAAWLEGWFESPTSERRFFDREAFQVGTFSSSVVGQSGPPNTFKYVLLFTRARGGWQIQCDIWNGDQPSR